MTINDILNEGIGPRTLFHFTDMYALEKILKTGYLKAREYPGNKKGERSVCVVRPSLANEKNISDLSTATAGGVKFIINASVLSDTVRGVKFNSVAEFPTGTLENIRNTTGLKRTEVNSLLKDLRGYNKLGAVKQDAKITEIRNKYGLSGDVAIKVVRLQRGLIRDQKAREGEERICLKDGSNIPLNPKYLKIEIQTGSDLFKESGKKLDFYKLIKKNEKYFVRNSEYKRVSNYLSR